MRQAAGFPLDPSSFSTSGYLFPVVLIICHPEVFAKHFVVEAAVWNFNAAFNRQPLLKKQQRPA